MDNTALKPTIFDIRSFKKNEEEKLGLTDEERQLSTLSNMEGWIVLKQFALQAMKELDAFNSEAIAKGMPFEEIGKNTVIISLAKEIVQRLINKVEDASEAVNTNGK